MAKQIKFHQNVSAVSGIYGADKTYTVADDVAADMIKAKHAVEVDESGKPVPAETKAKK